MSVTNSALASAAICLVGAGLEALFAGSGVRERLNSLRWPRYSPSFRTWIAIGAIYYLICFAIWFRMLQLPASSLRTTAMMLAATLMFANALWNLFFFRTRNLWHAFVFGVFYSGSGIVLFGALALFDSVAMSCFAPYLAYLIFANNWGYRVWKLNSDD